jgi:hypothetical protein
MFILLLSSLYYIATEFTRSPDNLLKEWNVDTEAKSFVLRNKYREWMVNKYDGWVEGIDLQTSVFPVPKQQEIEEYERIYNLLKLPESRRIYLKLGHSVFVSCSWCDPTASSDYILFNLPNLILTYSGMAFVLGLSTTTFRKSHWRQYGIIILGGLFAFELIYTCSLDFSETTPDETSFVEYATLYRTIAFVILNFLILIFSR